MANYKQLSINERKTIEELLNRGTSFKQIGLRLQRNNNTIAREVLRNAKPERTGSYGSAFNNCLNRHSCQWYRLCKKEDCTRKSCKSCKFCFRLCPDFKREYCDALESPPYVCNGCPKRKQCTLEKFIYKAAPAHYASREHARISREGIATSMQEIDRINSILSPLLKQGHSIGHILMAHQDELMISEKTLYTYIKLGLFDAKVMDQLHVAKMKPRRKRPKIKVDKAYLKGRSYRDFLAFLHAHPDTPIVQMDTVEGKKEHGEPVLLTIHFVEFELMLAFKRNANTAKSVIDIINSLHETLGDHTFKALFPVVVVDQGSEFSNPEAIERGLGGEKRTKVFFTDPAAPFQKGACENNHSLIRRVIPKGTSLHGYSQEDIQMMMNHINSYKRKKLKGKCPIEAFNFFHDAWILKQLGAQHILPHEVILNPTLFKKK